MRGNHFTGELPDEFARLHRLKWLDLTLNNLNGKFPPWIGSLRELEALYLGNNSFTGVIPQSIFNMFKLTTLVPSNNQLVGNFPAEIYNMSSLQIIWLSKKLIILKLNSFIRYASQTHMNFDINYLSGNLPSAIGHYLPNLVGLYLRKNMIGGTIPYSISNCFNLETLDLSDNSLASDPSSLALNFITLLAKCNYLSVISLDNNPQAGILPDSIGNLSSLLRVMSANSGKLFCTIPSGIGNLSSLNKLDLVDNQLIGSLPNPIKTLQNLQLMDLGGNKIKISNLISVTSTNFSSNYFSGDIPITIGHLETLQDLSLAHNQLQGHIHDTIVLCGAPRFHVPPCPDHTTQHQTNNINKHKLVSTLSTKIMLKSYELLQATCRYNQSNLLGNGSFGSVYKGTLEDATFEDGGIVAVKVFNLQIEGSFKSFDIECEVLRNLRHRNLTKVISSCSNPDFKALVLEYMPNGSLDGWLHSNNSILNVMQRLNILIDVACAIEYLHCGNLTPIVHCDLKPSNVLLDQEMVAHVSDFGIAKLLGQDNVTYTKTLATLCYIAPEGLVSTRCDIYSFGIMMMEVFTRKSPSDEMFGENLSLKSWVTEFMPNRLVNIIDVELLSTFNRHHHEILANILSIMDVALSCTKEFPRERSNIEEVLARVSKAITTTNITTDQLALLALKDGITELPSDQMLAKNWTIGSSVCDWIGVTCGSRHLRVTALNISGMNLAGTLPPQLGNLSFLVSLDLSRNSFHGGLPEEFSGLRRLKLIALSNNNFSGQFPPWIASFQELEYLNFWNNSFSGAIPQSISNMSKLTVFSVSYNNLQGNIPTAIFNMSSLNRISLSFNGFLAGSSLPDDMCRLLPRLKWLDLQGAGLIGQIPPSIGQCLQLQVLALASNSLNGGIPKEIGNLIGLQKLIMWETHLEGAIPKEIGNLSTLQVVDFTKNNLTGAIPDEIGKLSNLQYINFQENKLTGSIPEAIFNISTLTLLSFEGNHLSGYLPSTMGYTLPNLQWLNLNQNNIQGVIPISISNCSNIQLLDIGDNNFTGIIPNSLGDLSLLQRLRLFYNNFISDPSSPTLNFISSLPNCKHLVEISVDGNPLDGILPDSIGNLSTSFRFLVANNCKIRGTIPSGIGNLSSLSTFGLASNNLIGSLPNSIQNLQNLQRLYLSWNKLSISLQIFCPCKSLGFLYLEGNVIIGGAIPYCFGNIASMRYLNLDSSGLSSTLPSSFWNFKDILELSLSSNSLTGSLPLEISNLKMVTSMDFSNNYFSGNIPSTIGDLESLQNISLAHNQLQGHIPETIGKLWSLKQLDLSYNNLSGSLPMSLANLQELAFLNVSFNHLSGEIPSQGPFINLTFESFISNQALCGAPRFHVPPCSNHSTHHRMKSIHMQKIVIIFTVMISVVGIMCLGFIYLKYKTKYNITIDDDEGFSLYEHKRISYYELLKAIDGYNQSNLLGMGSFGSVYKGTLEDGHVVAVKVFNLQLEGSFKSFDTECEILRNLRHRNLVRVISSCSNPDFKALILDYMPNGSLDSLLHSNKYLLNVMQRLNILIDVACALQYLHCENLVPIVHCDLKPSNVLLNQEMVACVSDFGIAKLLDQESITYTKTLATLCYIAPEYASEGLVSTRCDIYSFGIMIMEVFTRKRPTDEMFGENLSLRSWVQQSMPDGLINDGRVVNVIDADLLSTFNQHYDEILASIMSIMEVALTCAKESPRERSNIEEVLASFHILNHNQHHQGSARSSRPERSYRELPSDLILAQNWTVDSSVCNWIGVTCGSRQLRVTALDLSDMKLTGIIPPHLGNLSFLVSLDMSGNQFNGGLIDEFSVTSPEISLVLSRSPSQTCPKFTTLFVPYNDLEGNLRVNEIFNVSSLESVSLSENAFSDGSSLPDDMCQRLPRLEWLGLAGTGLIGEIPKQIGNLKELLVIALWGNQLEGVIPIEVGNLCQCYKMWTSARTS
ncbi:OLC1v1025430C2 [Oldenlandia corymbosa var. corymbosa]|uniref:non-specific serine/threonine protein kinase n=1 Tax=Oldenlandia corymbosa var. corymbosa TaxID=529605 RepID=A0AAV1C823_OLDCO|nr:OLC1v1025430C2 [Oldenlandia corymbosa var. corymbosa]